MFDRMARICRAVMVSSGVLLVACSTSQSVSAQASASSADRIFIQLREAARRNDAPAAQRLAAQIPDYPAPGYVDYFRIKSQMFDSSGRALTDAPDDDIRAFLARYDGSAIADRMRNDYLVVLGARGDWRTFREEYARFVLDDDTQVKCYALEARAAHRENVADAARALLVDPRWYGDGCVDLIGALAESGQFTTDDVWTQIRYAYEGKYLSLGNRIADALGAERPSDQKLALAASRPPILLADRIPTNTPAHQLVLLAVIRMAANDPALAAATFSDIAGRLTAEERATGWGAIAYRAALRKMPAALDWYKQSAGGLLSDDAAQWRVRAALAAEDWVAVRWAIESMRPGLRADPTWIYWYGRALAAGGDSMGAAQQYAQIASQFNFYGQLAAEEMGRLTTLPPRTSVSEAEVQSMAGNPGFALAARFYALDLRLEGNREWNWQLRGMSDRQLLAAARYAQGIQLLDRTVNTADRTREEHDFSLRYLAPFKDIVERYARSTGLDVEWAYGLIRQESRFIIGARSEVGASGLMQLMPGTADLVARKLGLGKLSRAQTQEMDTNIQLGTNYLAMIYDQFGSPVLASAGYNAGPGRSRQWREALSRPVEGAIFAETIPFNETRGYVKNVLSNTVYYAALFEGRPQSLKARLGVITP